MGFLEVVFFWIDNHHKVTQRNEHQEAVTDYLVGYYNQHRPHQGVAFHVAEGLSQFSLFYVVQSH
ncbi:hypothetical protein BCS89_07125 [Vibrio splendidus]|nr:hypothetical protein BCS97_09005 [Vibrio splendidus]PMP29703.1 hypothetical protein BCS89_07125 [Vibrio splendidus]PMP36279.1 hypothetical protein BCS88_06895 [Vibrio splendidus]PMP45982.1 hypothetical protein BCS87_03610 [Vibrio splendidus]PMP48834.1 hypothetical protein BCS85_08855 [Vibrio splendidus]